MKIIKSIFIVILSLPINAYTESNVQSARISCRSCETAPKFNQVCPLVTAPCDRAKISESNRLFDDLFAAGKPIVLYVHGRGNEPKKTWKEGIVSTLEKDYDIKVVMFNWDSKALLFHRPINEAYASAPQLREFIDSLVNYRELNPSSKAVPVSLLVHSMGNIVFRKAVNDLPLLAAGKPLFTNIMMTGSDEDAEGHNVWIEQLAVQGKILITINKLDSTLSRSHHPDGKTPLGMNPKKPLANNAYYLDTTGLVGKVHRLFTKGKQHARVAICRITTAMLRGENPNFIVGLDIKHIEHDRVLVPVEKQNKADKCFQGVRDLPDSDDEQLDA